MSIVCTQCMFFFYKCLYSLLVNQNLFLFLKQNASSKFFAIFTLVTAEWRRFCPRYASKWSCFTYISDVFVVEQKWSVRYQPQHNAADAGLFVLLYIHRFASSVFTAWEHRWCEPSFSIVGPLRIAFSDLLLIVFFIKFCLDVVRYRPNCFKCLYSTLCFSLHIVSHRLVGQPVFLCGECVLISTGLMLYLVFRYWSRKINNVKNKTTNKTTQRLNETIV